MPSLALEKGLLSLEYSPSLAGSPVEPDGRLDAVVVWFDVEDFCLLLFVD